MTRFVIPLSPAAPPTGNLPILDYAIPQTRPMPDWAILLAVWAVAVSVLTGELYLVWAFVEGLLLPTLDRH